MQKIKLLLLEDQETDAAIIERVLTRSGMRYSATLVRNRSDFHAAITSDVFDVILADNYLPQFDAVSALGMLREHNITTPLILVTGTASEEYAVNMMKAGVWDYILKDRLQRLPNAILTVLERYTLEQDHKKQMDNLARQEALLRESERLAHIGSWEYDLVTGYSVWSDERYRILGYIPGEVAPTFENFLARIHPDDRTYVSDTISEAIERDTSCRYNYRVLSGNGGLRYFESQLFITRDALNTPVRLNGFSVDVTGRKLAEELHIKSEASLRTILDNTETGYALLNTSLEVVSYNQPMYEFSLTQLEKPVSVGGLAVSFFKQDRQPAAAAAMANAQAGIATRYEVPYLQPDGSTRWFDVNCHPVTGNDNKVIGIIMSETDITQRKVQEIRERLMTEDLMQRSNILEQFAYIISHNLRGPMTTILGIAGVFQDKHISDDDRAFFLQGIEVAVRQMDNVIIDLNNILQFRSTENEQRQNVSLSAIFDDVCNGLMLHTAGVSPVIRAHFGADEIVTIKSYIHNIFYNLLSNSIKFKHPSEPLQVDVITKRFGDKTLLLFSDNGMGMDMDKIQGQIFGMFKRFHPHIAGGKGMGLFMVKAQVKTLGGDISVKSRVNEGTEFRIEF